MKYIIVYKTGIYGTDYSMTVLDEVASPVDAINMWGGDETDIISVIKVRG